jgi:hypothetical protein
VSAGTDRTRLSRLSILVAWEKPSTQKVVITKIKRALAILGIT